MGVLVEVEAATVALVPDPGLHPTPFHTQDQDPESPGVNSEEILSIFYMTLACQLML